MSSFGSKKTIVTINEFIYFIINLLFNFFLIKGVVDLNYFIHYFFYLIIV